MKVRPTPPILPLALFALLVACAGDTAPAADAPLGDAADATDPTDAADEVSEPDPHWANVPEPTPHLMAGASTRSLRAPVGICTVGFGPSPSAGAPDTPFNDMFPGTHRLHSDLDVKAVVLRREGVAVVLARLDLVGVWHDTVEDVAARLRAEGRADLAEGLVLTATHTHAGPGRFIDHFIGSIAADSFSPPMFQRISDAIVEAVLEADASAVAARVGHLTLATDVLASPRRCETGYLSDGTLGIIKVETDAVEPGDRALLAVMLNHPMHGTVIGSRDYTLSSDAPGGVEHGIEARLAAWAPVLFLQSWAGDMSPGDPRGTWATDEGHEPHSGYVRIDALGAAAADLVIDALDGVPTTATPELAVVTERFPLSGLLANPDGAFDAWPHGALYCTPTSRDRCGPDAEPYEHLTCFPFEEHQTVTWSILSAVRIGDLGLVTLPGEPTTPVGLELRDMARAATGLPEIYVLGYSQGYLAYLVHPDDFWYGGYEAASALFGPGFGTYLTGIGTDLARRLVDPEAGLGFEPVASTWGEARRYDDYPIEPSLEAAAVVEEPAAEGDLRAVAFYGGDPALGAPRVTLEVLEGETWAPVRHPSGRPWSSLGPEIELQLAVDPAYRDAAHPFPRRFLWTARLPARMSVPPAGGQLEGTFRFVVEGLMPEPFALTSGDFDLP